MPMTTSGPSFVKIWHGASLGLRISCKVTGAISSRCPAQGGGLKIFCGGSRDQSSCGQHGYRWPSKGMAAQCARNSLSSSRLMCTPLFCNDVCLLALQ
eukprot:scaffold275815_cov37-Prasinocladus_malaysianus.AAC.1